MSILEQIIESDFYDKVENIVFIGDLRTGKTHLAILMAYLVAI